MSTRKTIGWALGAIIVLLVAQILAQLVASQSEHTFDYSAKRFKTTQALYIWALGGFFYFCELL